MNVEPIPPQSRVHNSPEKHDVPTEYREQDHQPEQTHAIQPPILMYFLVPLLYTARSRADACTHANHFLTYWRLLCLKNSALQSRIIHYCVLQLSCNRSIEANAGSYVTTSQGFFATASRLRAGYKADQGLLLRRTLLLD